MWLLEIDFARIFMPSSVIPQFFKFIFLSDRDFSMPSAIPLISLSPIKLCAFHSIKIIKIPIEI